MTLPPWLSFLPSLLAARSHPAESLLTAEQWSQVAHCERVRVNRNGSVLSVVSIRLPTPWRAEQGVNRLANFIDGRLRVTDTAGWQPDGRLGLLLPDTPLHGAEQVADEVLTFLGDEQGDVSIEIAVYPDQWDSPQRGEKEREAMPQGAMPAGVAMVSSVALFALPSPWWKRAIDLVGASILLLLFSPLIGALAFAVALTSKGGAFYRQEREGLGGRRFKMFKLRTMIASADTIQHRLRKHSVQDGPAFKMYRDPRVTPIGRLLRATSLDELPQLLNVLRGEMSLVGPRPLPVGESLSCKRWQRQRLLVTPGITCTWQVKGRNTVTFDEWMRMDLSYLNARSFWGDLRLILSTPGSILFNRGPR